MGVWLSDLAGGTNCLPKVGDAETRRRRLPFLERDSGYVNFEFCVALDGADFDVRSVGTW